MTKIKAGRQYFAQINGEKTVVTVKGISSKGPGFYSCEFAIVADHLTMFSVIDVAAEDILTDELPPEIHNEC